MKKLIVLLIAFLAPFSLFAGTQNGITIPDAIELYNSSENSIIVNGKSILPHQSISFNTDDHGSFLIKSNKRTYKVSHPTYNPEGGHVQEKLDTACLDFRTIQWLAGDLNKLFPRGLDSVSITNDTYYPIAVVYVLNAMRSQARRIDAQETISKVVGTDTNQKTGFLELIDSNRTKHTLIFPRRIYKKSMRQQEDWQEVTLRVATVAWFNKGFTVTVR